MIIKLLDAVEILDYEELIGVQLEVNERPAHYGKERFYVKFLNGEVMEGGCLVGYTGNGHTIDAALTDYCKDISNRKMAFNAYTKNRVERDIPKLIHTRLLNK